MTKHRGSFLFPTSVLLVVLSGCATVPNGPTVTVLPAPGKPFAQFQDDDAICRQWAAQQIGVTPQETVNQNTATGAVAGTLIGGGLGAAIGSASGHVGTGAAIGAGAGLLFGTLGGSDRGYYYERSVQQRYDIAYQQCMYAKGNQIPGTVEPTRRIYRRIPPPPPDLDSIPSDYRGSYDAPGQ